MADSLGPKPTTITGGCLCAALRYTVDLPPDHDFVASAMTCQCTQCRHQSGALFAAFHQVPPLQWTSESTSTLSEFVASADAKRGFCTACGSWLYYQYKTDTGVSLCLGTVDPEILFGKKGGVERGYGKALANGLGGHVWCENEILGVTDDVPLLNRGQRHQGNPG